MFVKMAFLILHCGDISDQTDNNNLVDIVFYSIHHLNNGQ